MLGQALLLLEARRVLGTMLWQALSLPRARRISGTVLGQALFLLGATMVLGPMLGQVLFLPTASTVLATLSGGSSRNASTCWRRGSHFGRQLWLVNAVKCSMGVMVYKRF